MFGKPLKVKNYYWGGTPISGVTGFWCFNRHKDHTISISVHFQYQCLFYAVTWENDNQRSKKSLLNEIDVQMVPIHLFLFILIVFVGTLFKIWVFVTPWRKTISFPKIARGIKLQTLFWWNITPKGLINHIRNIPKKLSTPRYREVLSFHCVVTESSDGKVIIDFSRKSYLQKDWFGLYTFM